MNLPQDHLAHDAGQPVGALPSGGAPLVVRLRNTPNWSRESYGHWKDMTSEYDRSPFEAADEIERLQKEVQALTLEIDRRKGDPSTRLHNICEAVSAEADSSVFSREEWDRIDAENVALRAVGKAAASLAAAVTSLEFDYINRWGENSFTTAVHNAGAEVRAALKRAQGEN